MTESQSQNHRIVVDKAVSHGDAGNNSEITLHVYWHWTSK